LRNRQKCIPKLTKVAIRVDVLNLTFLSRDKEPKAEKSGITVEGHSASFAEARIPPGNLRHDILEKAKAGKGNHAATISL